MTATVSRGVESMLDGYTITKLDPNDPVIVVLLNRFRRAMGMEPGGVPNDNANWRGLEYDGKVVVAFADARLPDGKLFVTNLCSDGSRAGAVGVYQVLKVYKAMLAAKQITSLLCTVIPKNKAMIRALRRIDGKKPKPKAYVYEYRSPE